MEESIIPSAFQELNLRTKGKYRNLSKFKFSVQHKTFAASELTRATAFSHWDGERGCTLGRFSSRYHIPKTTLHSWKKIYENPRLSFHSSAGRPESVDSAGKEEIVQTILRSITVKDALPHGATIQLVNKVVVDTRMRQGKRGADANVEISKTTRKKIFEELKIRSIVPQVLTDARRKACECIRTSYIWGCLLLAYSGHLRAEYKWNADATTIVVSESLTGSLVCAIKREDDASPVASSSIPDNLNILVKWFGLNNAGGESGPLVLVFAVPSMTEGTFFVVEVLGLASTSFVGDGGFVYFCKTRGGTPEMWTHYYLNVTVPTIKRSNSLHNFKVRS